MSLHVSRRLFCTLLYVAGTKIVPVFLRSLMKIRCSTVVHMNEKQHKAFADVYL